MIRQFFFNPCKKLASKVSLQVPARFCLSVLSRSDSKSCVRESPHERVTLRPLRWGCSERIRLNLTLFTTSFFLYLCFKYKLSIRYYSQISELMYYWQSFPFNWNITFRISISRIWKKRKKEKETGTQFYYHWDLDELVNQFKIGSTEAGGSSAA